MKTTATNKQPEISWSLSDHVDTHDHEEHFLARGYSDDGRNWMGTWIVTDGSQSEVVDIEKA